jgi:hypothetical protein
VLPQFTSDVANTVPISNASITKEEPGSIGSSRQLDVVRAPTRLSAAQAERLANAGTGVELRGVDTLGPLDAHDAVVFGAPIYDQSWPPEADRFVDQ